jgi:hypothetical protein
MKMMPSRVLTISLLVSAAAILSFASAPLSLTAVRGPDAMTAREHQLGKLSILNSNFSALARGSSRNSCEAVQPPEALATPAPLLDLPETSTPVTVSFIIGTDGRVHSPLILAGLGAGQDRVLLAAVLSWRYRPATCNGVPTEAEGKIAFSSQ